MLIQFNFKNFKSFRDETILDLSATSIREYSERVRTIGTEKILPVAAIYGANASGKSNVYQAFEDMIFYVLESFKFGGDDDDRTIIDRYQRSIPFLFDKKSKSFDTSFEVYFTLNNDKTSKVYKYGYSLNRKGISEEWLYFRMKTSTEYRIILHRDKNTLNLKGIDKEYRRNIEISLSKEVLVVSLGSKLKIPILSDVRNWFASNELSNYGHPYTSFKQSRILPNNFIKDEKVRQNVVKYLSYFDDHIKKLSIKELKDVRGKKMYRIDSFHRFNDSEEMTSIPLDLESQGTLKMFSMYQGLANVLKKGGVFFVDELDSKLHPLLLRSIILLFANKEYNKNNAQLIFTTHDACQLNKMLLRRDEVYFVEKDDNGVSQLKSLIDFVDTNGAKVRNDESYFKNYLLGKYGAIPKLKDNIFLGEDVNGK